MRSAVETFQRIAHRRRWTEAQTLKFLRGLVEHPATRHLFRSLELPPPVEGGSPNFIQISGPQGRTQILNAGAAPVTFIWNPTSLKGQLAGGDFLYAKRIKFRTNLVLTNNTTTNQQPPTWEAVAQTMGNVRVYSPFLGEVLPKSMNSVALLSNHDQYFVNAFRPITRRRPFSATIGGAGTVNYEFIFEVPFERDYLVRSTDSCPWLPWFEGGIFEVDLAPTSTLTSAYGWNITSATQTCTMDYYCDKQALIHTPIQARLYKVVSPGPEYILKAVGAPNGLDGVISGARLAVLSMLAKGYNAVAGSSTNPVGDNGFYGAFGGSGGVLFGTNGLSRVELPFRDQIGIDDVNAILESFLSDTNPIRMFQNENASTFPYTDITQFPFVDGVTAANAVSTAVVGGVQTLVCDLLDFWPLIWPQFGDKISDFQKVNGDLSLQLNFTGTNPGNILNLFRSEEICGFSPDKVMDMMDRMGLPHVQKGGAFEFVPKYHGAKRSDDSTRWGFPLKVIQSKAA